MVISIQTSSHGTFPDPSAGQHQLAEPLGEPRPGEERHHGASRTSHHEGDARAEVLRHEPHLERTERCQPHDHERVEPHHSAAELVDWRMVLVKTARSTHAKPVSARSRKASPRFGAIPVAARRSAKANAAGSTHRSRSSLPPQTAAPMAPRAAPSPTADISAP